MLEPFPVHALTGSTVYVCVFNDSGEVFDFDDNTWQSPSVAVDPYIAAPALPDTGGADYCDYLAEIDLDAIAPGPAVLFVRPKAFQREGVSNDLLTDTVIAQDAAWCVFGRSYRDDPRVECIFKGVHRRDDNKYDCSVGMTSAGRHVDLFDVAPTATCSVEVRQIGVDSPGVLFTLSASAPDSDSGRFEMQKSAPNFVANRGYYATITISAGAWTFTKTFSAFG